MRLFWMIYRPRRFKKDFCCEYHKPNWIHLHYVGGVEEDSYLKTAAADKSRTTGTGMEVLVSWPFTISLWEGSVRCWSWLNEESAWYKRLVYDRTRPRPQHPDFPLWHFNNKLKGRTHPPAPAANINISNCEVSASITVYHLLVVFIFR